MSEEFGPQASYWCLFIEACSKNYQISTSIEGNTHYPCNTLYDISLHIDNSTSSNTVILYVYTWKDSVHR